MRSVHRAVLARRSRALVAAIALVVVACGNGGDEGAEKSGVPKGEVTTTTAGGLVKLTGVPGVTDTEIRFAAFGTNSNNPLGTCVLDCYLHGVKAYFAWRNSEGGIYGRKLVLSKVLDDELGKNQQRALEIISANDTFASFAAGQLATGWAEFAKAGIPLYVWNIWPNEAARPSIFGESGVICIRCRSRAVAHVVRLAKAKRVAVIGYGVSENSKLSALNNKDSVEYFSDELGGATVVYTNVDLPFGLPNGVAPEVTAMKRAGVDLVLGSIDLNGMKTFAQEMARQGMGDVPMYHPNTYDEEFVRQAGDLFEGDYVGVSIRPFESNAAGSQLDTFKEWMRKIRAPRITEIALRGWVAANTAYTGLKEAGPNFDRAKVISATNRLTRYTAGGMTTPIDWTRQHELPTPDNPGLHGPDPDCTAIVQVRNRKFVLVPPATPDKPFLCWPGEDREWYEPEAMNFT
jgi:branched-chain amino acid transport system substrate-binding protein